MYEKYIPKEKAKTSCYAWYHSHNKASPCLAKFCSDHEIFNTKIKNFANFECFTKILCLENLELYGVLFCYSCTNSNNLVQVSIVEAMIVIVQKFCLLPTHRTIYDILRVLPNHIHCHAHNQPHNLITDLRSNNDRWVPLICTFLQYHCLCKTHWKLTFCYKFIKLFYADDFGPFLPKLFLKVVLLFWGPMWKFSSPQLLLSSIFRVFSQASYRLGPKMVWVSPYTWMALPAGSWVPAL